MDQESFRDFIERSSAALLRSAWYLTLDDQHAEDLLQTALVKTWRRWPQLVDDDRSAEAYVRKAMVNTATSWRRRKWTSEIPTSSLPDRPLPGEAVDDGEDALRMLALLPPRQHAAIYLRYMEDLSERETALIMGCSVGTVKSQVSRALTTLRRSPLIEDATAHASRRTRHA